MTKFTRNQTIVAYYTKGEACIEDAGFLFQQKRIQVYGILLLQGVELLLKSFLLIKDPSVTLDILKNQYSHGYYKIFKKCLELDDEKILSNNSLATSIQMLDDSFERSYVDLRYPNEPRLRKHPTNIFSIINMGLIEPMKDKVHEHYKLGLAEDGPSKNVFAELGVKKINNLPNIPSKKVY